MITEITNLLQLNDEMPDINEITGSEKIRILFSPSEKIIKELNDYNKINNKQVQNAPLETEENYYKEEKKYYYYTEKQWEEITKIIADMKNTDMLIKTIKKSKNMTKGIKEDIKEIINEYYKQEKKTIYGTIVTSLQEEIITELVLKSLHIQLTKYYSNKENIIEEKKDKEVEHKIMYNVLAGTLGNIISQYILETTLYTNKKMGNEHKMEYITLDPLVVKELSIKIINNTIEIQDYVTISMDIAINNKNILSWINAGLVLRYIQNEDELDKNVSFDILQEKAKYEKILYDMEINIGIELLDFFIKLNFIIQTIDSRKVPHIVFTEELKIKLFVCARYLKPV